MRIERHLNGDARWLAVTWLKSLSALVISGRLLSRHNLWIYFGSEDE